MALEDLKKYFPIRVESLEEFVDVVRKNSGTYVTGRYNNRIKRGRETKNLGVIYDFVYFGEFRSESVKRRPIMFDPVYGCRTGTENGVIDAEDRYVYELRSLRTTEVILDIVGERLPWIRPRLLGLDDITLRRMHNHIKEADLAPFTYKSIKIKRISLS